MNFIQLFSINFKIVDVNEIGSGKVSTNDLPREMRSATLKMRDFKWEFDCFNYRLFILENSSDSN